MLNCGLPETFGSGIAKVPEQRLSDLTIIGLPAIGVVSVVESASGVTNALTSTLSKNTYILVNGLTPVAVKLIFLARTTGIATLEIVLNPETLLYQSVLRQKFLFQFYVEFLPLVVV